MVLTLRHVSTCYSHYLSAIQFNDFFPRSNIMHTKTIGYLLSVLYQSIYKNFEATHTQKPQTN